MNNNKHYYIEAPNQDFGPPDQKRLFLAGSITGAWFWQDELVKNLADQKITIYNPRRINYQKIPGAIREQIEWEFHHLRLSDIISFYFAPKTLSPITMFEYGKYINKTKYNPDSERFERFPIFVAVHPEFPRREDLIIQTELEAPHIKIVDTVEKLAEQIKEYLK